MFYAKYFKYFLFTVYVVRVLPSFYHDPSNCRPKNSVYGYKIIRLVLRRNKFRPQCWINPNTIIQGIMRTREMRAISILCKTANISQQRPCRVSINIFRMRKTFLKAGSHCIELPPPTFLDKIRWTTEEMRIINSQWTQASYVIQLP